METASIRDIKSELSELPAENLAAICLQLARLRKENKEFIHFLIFENVHDIEFTNRAIQDMDQQFGSLNTRQVYLAMKTLRKVLRNISKLVKFSGSARLEADLLIHFCRKLRQSGLDINSQVRLQRLYQRQVEKISKAVSKLHEDLRYDYTRDISSLF